MMARRHRRRALAGFTLVELLVALPLTVLVAAMATVVMVRQVQHIRSAESRSGGSRELRHARLAMESDFGPLQPHDFVSVADSLIEFRTQLGVAQICRLDPGNALTVSASDHDGDWLASVRAGDAITLWTWDGAGDTPPHPLQATVVGVASPLGHGRCGADSSERRWRIPVSGVSQTLVLTGTPARFQRGVRYSHYRSGSDWWLGRRTRDANGWDVVQPLAGPLQPPAQAGMRASLRDAAGTPVGADAATALHVSLRMPRAVQGRSPASDDSVHFETTLRGAASAPRP